ncbi:hypothetical protein F5880DRAFT_1618208 [Lentinula raphanica]|nr:hypothetical protein F5880DRAFT_1618208 [Lentinula raphanica]
MFNIEDDESEISPTSISTIALSDLSLTEQLQNWSMESAPTCRPILYESSNPRFDSSQSGQYPFYNVYAGDHPGADASGRVTNVKGSRHKGYKTWAQALEGWQQNCRAYHHHSPGMVDGTTYTPSPRPETPPPVTPPPSRHNIERFEAKPSTPTKPKTPMNRSANKLRPPMGTSNEMHAPMGRTPNNSHHQYWAIQSPDFVGVVSSTAQAQNILDNAAAHDKDITLCLVNNLSEAQEWLNKGDAE